MFVYFIRSMSKPKYTKIGYSASPEKRMADLARDMGIHPNMITRCKANGWKIAEGRLWSPKQKITNK